MLGGGGMIFSICRKFYDSASTERLSSSYLLIHIHPCTTYIHSMSDTHTQYGTLHITFNEVNSMNLRERSFDSSNV